MNADVIAREGRLGSFEAGRATLSRLKMLLAQRADIVFETTLSSNHAVSLMRDARSSGYEIGFVFVALSDAELNVRRVRERVARGGHAIPEQDIRRRYPRAFANLAAAFALADGSLVYDNSGLGPELLVRLRERNVESLALDGAKAHHVAVARALAQVLSRTPEQILMLGDGA
ncbi:zeta toxin family protein [Salinarimonas ramus]|uniref:zeta toxin family protein n=1 Tax=Salinarimonas ramus TaxID=690164 RepID=UPI0016660FFB|nr:zeta toxin family protein [Salinarimonas ramus]